MVMMDQPTFPGCVIAARPIGMLEMIDGGDRDEKTSLRACGRSSLCERQNFR